MQVPAPGLSGCPMQFREVIAELKSMGDPESAAGMARYGIKADRALGVSIPKLRALAQKIGQNRKLAGELWPCGIHEARILACMIDDPQQVTAAQLECWVKEFDSWDLCDQCCNRLLLMGYSVRDLSLYPLQYSLQGLHLLASLLLQACFRLCPA